VLAYAAARSKQNSDPVRNRDPARSPNTPGRATKGLKGWLAPPSPCDVDTCRVIPSHLHHNGEPIRQFHRRWHSACAKVGLSVKIPHDMRPTAARNLIRAGVPTQIAKQLTGHKTDTVSALRYCQSLQARRCHGQTRGHPAGGNNDRKARLNNTKMTFGIRLGECQTMLLLNGYKISLDYAQDSGGGERIRTAEWRFCSPTTGYQRSKLEGV
jgi:hypothetical protein